MLGKHCAVGQSHDAVFAVGARWDLVQDLEANNFADEEAAEVIARLKGKLLVALALQPRCSDEGQAEDPLLLGVADIVEDNGIAGENALDLCFEVGGSHDMVEEKA